MITIKQLKMGTPKVVNGTKQDRGLFSMAGLVADGKPTTSYDGVLIANTSVYMEIDAGITYLYDEEHAAWNPMPVGSGTSVDIEGNVVGIASVAETKSYVGV